MGITKIDKVTIIGSGVMGRGIAVASAMKGVKVTLHDLDENVLDSALKNIKSTAKHLRLLGAIIDESVIMRNVRTELDLRASLNGSPLAIENVPQNLLLKQRVFEAMDNLAPPDAVLGSNSGGLMITKIAALTKVPERVVGIHFFAPAYILKVVEIIPGRKTSKRALRVAKSFATRIGKVPIILMKDKVNFLLNTIQFGIIKEAKRLVKNGIVSSIADVDLAMMHSFPLRHSLFGLFLDEDLVSPYSAITHPGRIEFETNYSYKQAPDELIEIRDTLLYQLERTAETLRKKKPLPSGIKLDLGR